MNILSIILNGIFITIIICATVLLIVFKKNKKIKGVIKNGKTHNKFEFNS